jgi:hypothetical protein
MAEEKDRLAEAGIYAALNNYFGVRPKVEVELAKKDMLRLRQLIDIMLEKIEVMQDNFPEFRDKH